MSSIIWYNNLEILLRHLPDPDKPVWTDSQRALWIVAFSALLDLLIEVEPDTIAPNDAPLWAYFHDG